MLFGRFDKIGIQTGALHGVPLHFMNIWDVEARNVEYIKFESEVDGVFAYDIVGYLSRCCYLRPLENRCMSSIDYYRAWGTGAAISLASSVWLNESNPYVHAYITTSFSIDTKNMHKDLVDIAVRALPGLNWTVIRDDENNSIIHVKNMLTRSEDPKSDLHGIMCARHIEMAHS
jgi:hypothetical protein